MNASYEQAAWQIKGVQVFPVILALGGFGGWILRQSLLVHGSMVFDSVAFPLLFWGGVGILVLASIISSGFFIVEPNQARVMTFLGRYKGSIREPGFYWIVPFLFNLRRISLRVRNFNSEKLKVNDAQGSPIEIAAVVVWRVVDSAKAILDVESYNDFVAIQSEAALRSLAGHYSYDNFDAEHQSLRDNPDQVANVLKQEVQRRLEVSGVEVLEARITHLAYAPEIAQAMLRRQQAIAVIAAKERIVEGALGMVEMALKRLSDQEVVELDEERKASMVNNLLVALVSESSAQPIINAGSLYS